MRIAVAVVLSIHGLIHLLGWLKSAKLMEVPQLTGRTLFELPEPLPRVVGVLWLVCCLTFLSGAGLLLLRSGSWWIAAAVGIVLSQLLIVYAWPDAKAGTLPNLLLLIPIVMGWAGDQFRKDTDEQASALLSSATEADSPVVTPDMLESLPAPVGRWLEQSGVVGRNIPRTVRLKQRATMRTEPGSEELPASAQQYYRVDQPGFIWQVRLQMLHVLPVIGRDTYLEGKGHMLIKVASLIPVADAKGSKIDQGSLLRYLGETVWFPAAALSSYIDWEPIDDRSARATMRYGGVTGTAVFLFDAQGRFVRLTAERYFGGEPDAKLEKWEVEASAWGRVSGYDLPIQGVVRWKLAQGDFDFYRWELTDIEYDPAAPYAANEGFDP